MNVLLAIVFVLLVIIDMILTYRCIESGKGKESAFAKYYIKNKWLTVFITTIGVMLILLLTAQTPLLLLIPIVAFGYACWHNWEVMK